MTTTADLRRLAEQATPGPWTGTTIGTRSQADAAQQAADAIRATRAKDDPDGEIQFTDLSWVRTAGDDWLNVACVGNGPNGPENAAYIAAANPQAILALLDERDGVVRAYREVSHRILAAERRVAALEDALASAEARVSGLEEGLKAIEEVAQFGSSTLAAMVTEKARALLASPSEPPDLAEWNAAWHEDHEVDSNGFCNDCMKFTDDTPAALPAEVGE